MTELWTYDERGVLCTEATRDGHEGLVLPHSMRGWASVERFAVILVRTDRAEEVPKAVVWRYQTRYPRKVIQLRGKDWFWRQQG